MKFYQKQLLLAVSFAATLTNITHAQQIKKPADTLISKYLPEITIVGRNSKSDIQQLPQIEVPPFMPVRKIH